MVRRSIPLLAALLASGTGGVPARCEEPGPPAPPEGLVVVDSFDAEALRPEWKADGAKIARVPEGDGGALEISEGVAVPPLRPAIFAPLPVRDLRRFDALAFRIRGLPAPLDLSVYLRKGETLRALEEPIEVKSSGWQEVVLPLRHMRDGADGLLVDPADLDRIEIRWRNPVRAFRLDDLRLLPGSRGVESWRLTEEDLLELAFGKGRGRITRGRSFVHLTDHPEWTEAESMRSVRSWDADASHVESRYGMKGGIRWPIRALRVRDEAEGRRIREVLGDLLDGTMGGLGGPGASWSTESITILVGPPRRSASSGNRDLHYSGWSRSYVDAFLGQQGAWLSGAILHDIRRDESPEDYRRSRDFGMKAVSGKDFKDFLQRRPCNLDPWQELFSLDRTRKDRLRDWEELVTIVEFLLSSHRPRLGRVWEAVRTIGGGPGDQEVDAIARALETTPAKLEQDWAKWGAANWK